MSLGFVGDKELGSEKIGHNIHLIHSLQGTQASGLEGSEYGSKSCSEMVDKPVAVFPQSWRQEMAGERMSLLLQRKEEIFSRVDQAKFIYQRKQLSSGTYKG